MTKPTLISIFLLLSLNLFSQDDILIFKKNHKTISTYTKGSYISFMTADHQWMKGIVTYIGNDSFYLKEEVVKYNMMGNDTFHYSGLRYAVEDIYALPKQGVFIDRYNGQYKITTAGGHVHWYWIKSGWIFRAGAIGYASLNVANGIINHNLSFAGYKTEFAIAGGTFLFGVLLHKLYKPWLVMGKKYHIKIAKLG
jgi:hypothetical protein